MAWERAVAAGQVYRANHAGVANIDHVGQALETVQAFLPVDFQIADTRQQAVAGIDVQGGQRCSGGRNNC